MWVPAESAGASIFSELIELLTNYGGDMANESLKKLYVDELKDLFSAENQLLKALPKMAKAASSNELRAGFEKAFGTDQRPRPTPGRDLPISRRKPGGQEVCGA